MKGKIIPALLLSLFMLPIIIGFHPSGTSNAEGTAVSKPDPLMVKESRKYITAVKTFADNSIKYGKDVYGPIKNPLFVDGLNLQTKEPVKWKFPEGDEWVLVDIGNQQNLYRMLVGLSNLTNEKKYKAAAVDAVSYSLRNLRYGKLLAWGGHMAYNATADSIVFAPDKGKVQELKSHYPYYELMWEVDPAETKVMIENIWNSHILDWSNLDFNRHGAPRPMGELWKNEYKGGEVFFWGKGLTFKNAGSDLYFAASVLSKYTNDKDPLIWAKRLAKRYVETRDPKTGLSGFQFSQSATAWCDGPKIRGDRAVYQYGDDFPGHKVFEGTLFPCYGNTPYYKSELCSFYLADLLGKDGEEFRKWALEEVKSWAVSSYRKKDNTFIPMLTDGTSMEGYVCKKDGYFGPKGRVLTAGWAGTGELWIYARAAESSDDKLVWEMARNIAMANNFGDIGEKAGDPPALDFSTECSEYQAIFAFLSLYRKTGKAEFLKMGDVIGKNILKDYYRDGFFISGKDSRYVRFDSVESLALLTLAAVLEGREEKVPFYPGGKGFFASAYGDKGHKYDNEFIYSLHEGE